MPVVKSIEACYEKDVTLQATGAERFHWYKDLVGGIPFHTGPQFTFPLLTNDTVVYVSNANKNYESLRTAASVSIQPNPVITASGSLQFCEGEAVALSVDTGEEYTWSTGEKTRQIEARLEGDYTVAVKNGVLECTDAIRITVYPKPVASFISSIEVITTQQPILFTNTSEGAEFWNWEFGDGATSHEEHPEHIYSIGGNYTISLRTVSDKGCADIESKSFGIITATEHSQLMSISFYPNPGNTKTMNISRPFARASAEIRIVSGQGDEVLSISLTENESEGNFDVSNLSNGIYVALITSKGKTLSKKIVIAR